MFQDSAPLVYDSGNYLPTLEQAAEMIGYEQFVRDEQPRLRAEGRHVGIGVACYVEGTGIGPYEGARVTVEPSGSVRVATGVGTQGQGHFTVFAQIVADVLGVDVQQVRVVTGDTREFHWGTGHVRQPRRGGRRQRVPRRGDAGAREDSRRWRRQLLGVAERRSWSWRAAACASRDRARPRIAPRRAVAARRIRCAARCAPAPSLGSRAPPTSDPIAAARPAASTR